MGLGPGRRRLAQRNRGQSKKYASYAYTNCQTQASKKKMSLWKLVARRRSGFCLELGIYQFDPVDRPVERDRIILTNLENDTNFDIEAIQFVRLKKE